MFYVVIARIKNGEGQCRQQRPGSHIILPPKSVVDPDSLNPDPDTDSDPILQVNLDLCDDVFLLLMSSHLDILWRVIPSSPPMDMKQYRY